MFLGFETGAMSSTGGIFSAILDKTLLELPIVFFHFKESIETRGWLALLT